MQKAFSQEQSVYGNQTAVNVLYGTLGFQPGEFFFPLTLNFERTVYDVDFVKFNIRAGFGFWIDWTEKGIDIPVSGQVVFFKKSLHPEIGIGAKYIYDFGNNMTGLSHLLNIACRYQKTDGDFMFKIGIEKDTYVFYPFFSAGYAF